jgi:hypothetical protein
MLLSAVAQAQNETCSIAYFAYVVESFGVTRGEGFVLFRWVLLVASER